MDISTKDPNPYFADRENYGDLRNDPDQSVEPSNLRLDTLCPLLGNGCRHSCTLTMDDKSVI